MAQEPAPTPPPPGSAEGEVPEEGSYAQTRTGEFERTRVPRPGEMLGVVEALLGGNHLRVRCVDGKSRLGRIPGRMKRRLWVKTGDLVLVTPWSFQDSKADVLYRYTRPQVEWLQKRGIWKAP
ncbi:MAG: translation initiation factor eIF-1A [Halobacteria archaeon]